MLQLVTYELVKWIKQKPRLTRVKEKIEGEVLYYVTMRMVYKLPLKNSNPK